MQTVSRAKKSHEYDFAKITGVCRCQPPNLSLELAAANLGQYKAMRIELWWDVLVEHFGARSFPSTREA